MITFLILRGGRGSRAGGAVQVVPFGYWRIENRGLGAEERERITQRRGGIAEKKRKGVTYPPGLRSGQEAPLHRSDYWSRATQEKSGPPKTAGPTGARWLLGFGGGVEEGGDVGF